MYQPRHFNIYELTCKHVYDKFGDTAFQIFDEKLLRTLDLLRDHLGSITVNTWHEGGQYSQRGFRCLKCSIVQDNIMSSTDYVSAHMTGQAADFDVRGLKSEIVRQWIIDNQILLPYPVRLERDVDWVHCDTRDTGQKVYLFNS